MNLRSCKALNERTQKLHDERARTLATSPLNRIVFIQRIAMHVGSIARVAQLAYVSCMWSDAIKAYSQFLWRDLVKSDDTAIKFKGEAHDDDYAAAYTTARGMPPPKPAQLAKASAGLRLLIALCSNVCGHECPWLVYVLISKDHAAVPLNTSHGSLSYRSTKWSPLRFAVAHGLLRTIDVLLECGATVDAPVLTEATKRGDHNALEKLLAAATPELLGDASLFAPEDDAQDSAAAQTWAQSFFPGLPQSLNPAISATARKPQTGTVLHAAIQQAAGTNNVDLLVTLLKRMGKDTFAKLLPMQDRLGNTALHAAVCIAANSSDTAALSWLLQSGMVSNELLAIRNYAKQTAHDIAVEGGLSREVVLCLQSK